MELFDKRFVHFMWDDELEGKTGHVSNDIKCLCDYVNNNNPFATKLIEHSSDESQPFQTTDGIRFRFFYYDPNYEVKKAFNEGKKIQFKDDVTGEWCPAYNLRWDLNIEYRVKPEEEKWIAYLARQKNGLRYLTSCTEDMWESAQKDYGAKTKLCVGTYDEVNEWFEARQKFADIIEAWEDGEDIQFRRTGFSDWISVSNPLWDVHCEYSVKSEEKNPYRPYNTSAEMIADFITRFKVKCLSYEEPRIWVKGKDTDIRFLIFAFYETFIKFNDDEPFMFKELFDGYTYLDGSPCGMKVKE